MTSILFVVNEAAYFFSHRLALAKAVQTKGWTVHVAVPILSDSVQKSFQVHNITAHQFITENHILKELHGIYRLNSIVREINPDLVHLVTLKSSLRWFMMLFRARKAKSVHTIAGFGQLAGRNLPAMLGKALMKFTLAILSRTSPSLFVVQNPDDAAELCRQHIMPPHRLFMVQGSGVDTVLYKPNATPSKNTKILVIGTACRRLSSKGLPALMDVMRHAKSQNLPIQLKVASVPVASTHREAISDAQWQAWLTEDLFVDAGKVDDMPSFYQSLDAFIYLSTSGEGLAKTLLEAASCALPVITTRQPGCKEAVIENETGYLVDPNDTDGIIEHLKTLLAATETRHEMGKAGRAHIEANFADNIVIERMLGLYEKAMAL